jgi:hypothetical protein
MDKAPFRDSRAPSWLTGPGTDVLAEPPSHRPYICIKYLNLISTFVSLTHNTNISKLFSLVSQVVLVPIALLTSVFIACYILTSMANPKSSFLITPSLFVSAMIHKINVNIG